MGDHLDHFWKIGFVLFYTHLGGTKILNNKERPYRSLNLSLSKATPVWGSPPTLPNFTAQASLGVGVLRWETSKPNC